MTHRPKPLTVVCTRHRRIVLFSCCSVMTRMQVIDVRATPDSNSRPYPLISKNLAKHVQPLMQPTQHQCITEE